MNFVYTVFEQGDKMLILLSMEKNNGRMQPKEQILMIVYFRFRKILISAEFYSFFA